MFNGPADTPSPSSPFDLVASTSAAAPVPAPDPGTPSSSDALPVVETPFGLRPLWERAGLQLAHRCGAAAMLMFVGGVAAAATRREYRPLLLGAFVLADVALAGALVAWRSARAGNRSAREAVVAAAFSAAWLAPSAVWLAIRRFSDE